MARVQDGQTAIVGRRQAGKQGRYARDDSRHRHGADPRAVLSPSPPPQTPTEQTSDLTDLVITVTPHIIRTAEIKQADHLAKYSGTAGAGLAQTIEDVMLRAQAEDDQDRRVIALQDRQQQQQAQPNVAQDTPGTPQGTTLYTAALKSETTAPMTSPAPKVDTPNFSAPAPMPVNNATSGMMSSNGLTPGLTPPPPANAFQPESKANTSNQVPMQNVSLTNTAPPPDHGQFRRLGPKFAGHSGEFVFDLRCGGFDQDDADGQEPADSAAQFKRPNVNPPSTNSQSSTPPNGVGPAKVQPVSRPERGGANTVSKPDSTPPKEDPPVKLPDDFVPPTIEGPKEPVAPAGIKMRPTFKNSEESDRDSASSTSGRASARTGGANRSAGSEEKASAERSQGRDDDGVEACSANRNSKSANLSSSWSHSLARLRSLAPASRSNTIQRCSR